MFTGIVETLAKVLEIRQEGSNKRFTLEIPFLAELKVDQSIAHNGVCLTVEKVNQSSYEVVAIQETLSCTNLNAWQVGNAVNIERCMPANGRFDGHIVQGHVDAIAKLYKVENKNGSWDLHFTHDPQAGITVEKGSICINGISLTVVISTRDSFSVSIIPYTWENTNLNALSLGDQVNIEFDILGKYLQKIQQ
jgi:riboflavin synthase